MVIVDTNIIIDHLRQHPSKQSYLDIISQETQKNQICISTISIQELYVGKSTLDKQAEQFLLATISPLKILSYSYQIAELAGTIMRDAAFPIVFADAAIAATAITHEAPLATINTKDFKNIPTLSLYSL